MRGYLEAQPDIQVVAEAEGGGEAVQLAEELVPDVVLMDLIMAGMDGIEAAARIRRVSPRSQIVVLTSFHDDSHVFPAIKAGASSYLLKDIAPAALVAAVRAAARGEPTLHPRVAARLLAEGLPNAEIAERLVLSEKTVKGHVSNILAKLHLADRTQAAVFAWREGVVRRD